MIDIAYAMGQVGAGGEGGGGFTAFIPLVLMFVVFYFLLIRPQQKKTKEHRQMIETLKIGDNIITGGGIHGRIESLDEHTATIEIADNITIKINRASIGTLVSTGTLQKKKKKEDKKD